MFFIYLFEGKYHFLSFFSTPHSAQCQGQHSKNYLVTDSFATAKVYLHLSQPALGRALGSLATDNTAPEGACEGPGKSLGFINTIQALTWNDYRGFWGIRNILNLHNRENTGNINCQRCRRCLPNVP